MSDLIVHLYNIHLFYFCFLWIYTQLPYMFCLPIFYAAEAENFSTLHFAYLFF